MTNKEIWYRYESCLQENGKVRFDISEFLVLRHTPKCVEIDNWGMKKFVLKNARKRYAYPTKELAKESFIIRKQKQIGHLKNQLKHAERALEAITTGENMAYNEHFCFSF